MNNSISQIFPLTEMQKGMLFHSVMEPNSGIYCEQFMFEITGELDADRIEKAWQSVVDDNDILRIAARFKGLREPVQLVYDQVSSPLAKLDLSGSTGGQFKEKLEDFLVRDRRRGFEFEKPALIRAALIRLSSESHLFLLTYHHLILDAWSLFLLMKELVEQYDTGKALAKVRPFYSEYVRSLRLDEHSGDHEFWGQYLRGYDAVTAIADVSSDRAPTRNATETHLEYVYSLPAELSERLLAFSRNSGLTLNTLIQGAWGLVVGAASGDDDVVFGITITHRPHEIDSIDRMVGIFINSLPKRVHLHPEDGLHHYLNAVQMDQANIKRHEHVPLPDIQVQSKIKGGDPIFETLLIFENFLKNPSWQQARDFSVKYYRYIGWTNYPMAIEAMPPDGPNPLFFQVKFDTNRFSQKRVIHLMQEMERYLAIIANGENIELHRLVSVRRREPVLPRVARANTHRSVADDIHLAVAAIWRDVLEVKEIDESKTFFEAGGHSLLLFKLQTRIQERLGVEIDILDLFDSPTISEQAELLRRAKLKIA